MLFPKLAMTLCEASAAIDRLIVEVFFMAELEWRGGGLRGEEDGKETGRGGRKER